MSHSSNRQIMCPCGTPLLFENITDSDGKFLGYGGRCTNTGCTEKELEEQSKPKISVTYQLIEDLYPQVKLTIIDPYLSTTFIFNQPPIHGFDEFIQACKNNKFNKIYLRCNKGNVVMTSTKKESVEIRVETMTKSNKPKIISITEISTHAMLPALKKVYNELRE